MSAATSTEPQTRLQRMLPPLMRKPSLFRALEFFIIGVGFSYGLSALTR